MFSLQELRTSHQVIVRFRVNGISSVSLRGDRLPRLDQSKGIFHCSTGLVRSLKLVSLGGPD